MKVDFCSDLHMEINGNVDNLVSPIDTESSVLILAGDITCFRFFNQKKTDAKSRSMRKRFSAFVNKQHHDHIYWIPGNHEYYNYYFDGAVEDMQEHIQHIDSRLKLVNNETFTHDDVSFFFSTFWTDFNNNNPLAKMSVENGMNDYRVIAHKLPEKVTYQDRHMFSDFQNRFTAQIAYEENKKAFYHLVHAYENRGDKKFVVATHHGPSLRSHNIHRFGYSDLMYGYLSNYDNWIESADICAWIHGHTHHNIDYDIEGTRIVGAMYGYLMYDRLHANRKMKFGRLEV